MPIRAAVGQEVLILPTGDHHHNTKDCEVSRLTGLVNWCVDKEQNGSKVYWIGTGDYLDSFSPSERASLKVGLKGYGQHDTTNETLDEMVIRCLDNYAAMMDPVKHQWITMLTGHHVHDFLSDDYFGTNSDVMLSKKMGCNYSGDGSLLLRLDFQNLDGESYGQDFYVYLSHGYGSARTEGARVMKRKRMRDVVLTANVYVMAHDDDKMVYPTEPLIPDPKSPDGVSYLKQYFMGVGGFQRSYRMGSLKANYVEQLLLPPAALGINIVRVVVEQRGVGYRLDYHVSV